MKTVYDKRYQTEGFYWGTRPSSLCYEILKLAPPVKELRVLDVGCGEGKDAVFLARNGYHVSGFDASSVGIEKAKLAAERLDLSINFFVADINEFRANERYDIIFSSGTLQYIKPSLRGEILSNYKEHTFADGIHALHTFVGKPFVAKAPDAEENEALWASGELMMKYKDWWIEWSAEEIRSCQSSGVPHWHAHNRVIARNRISRLESPVLGKA